LTSLNVFVLVLSPLQSAACLLHLDLAVPGQVYCFSMYILRIEDNNWIAALAYFWGLVLLMASVLKF